MSKFSTFPPLGLAYVAAVTPSNWEVEILDENFEAFSYKAADLVGITAFTSNINRAYELAEIYRNGNIKVIIGGIHASMFPEEALQFTDSVLIGEVEGIWPEVIKDFEKNNLKKQYIGQRIDLTRFHVAPRRDLLNSGYFWDSLQTSRGCPFNCNFCSVSKYLGKKYRQHKSDDVLQELEVIKGKYIAFLDDNLIGYSTESNERAIKIFQGMIDRGLDKKWWMQSSINAAEDERVVELAARAGCMFVFIGFETINDNTLQNMQKGVNLKIGIKNYKRVVDIFHKYGIGVLGAFIIGNDNESFDYYNRFADYLVDSNIDIIQISILTPLPGTQLMEDFQKQGRLIYTNFPRDWDKYRFSYMVHQPVESAPETVYIGNNFIKKRLYSFPTYQLRLLKSFIRLRNSKNFFAVLKLNRALKKSWLNSHYAKRYSKKLP